MAEEITKIIENVDELFPEIVVNGESHVSERYIEPEPTLSQSLPQSSEEQTDTQPQQTVQGEYVDTLNLNGVEHDLKDSPLSAEVQALQTLLSTIQSRLNELNALIPSTATAQNQLADKNFVNSSISTNTANFLGTYTSLADIEAIQNPTNNDYAFLETADGAGNNVYDRYKYSAEDGEWLFEYELNNSSFTAEQWATINSGITQVSDTVQDGDTDPVSSDAVYEALQSAMSTPVDVVEDGNMNPVTSNAVADKINSLDVSSVGGSGKFISAISETDGVISATASALSTAVINANDVPPSSGAIYNITYQDVKYGSSNDCNTMGEGLALINNQTLNSPHTQGLTTDSIFYLLTRKIGSDSGYRAQIAISYQYNNIFTRTDTDIGWSAWKKVVMDADLTIHTWRRYANHNTKTYIHRDIATVGDTPPKWIKLIMSFKSSFADSTRVSEYILRLNYTPYRGNDYRGLTSVLIAGAESSSIGYDTITNLGLTVGWDSGGIYIDNPNNWANIIVDVVSPYSET